MAASSKRKKSSTPRVKSVKNLFSERCYTLLKTVPKGSVTTYAEMARAMKTKAYRAVGQAMSRNPNAPKVPCHRVVCSDGKLGGYAFGVDKKVAILKKEGVIIKGGRVQNLEQIIHRF